jgi:hypothetical protein
MTRRSGRGPSTTRLRSTIRLADGYGRDSELPIPSRRYVLPMVVPIEVDGRARVLIMHTGGQTTPQLILNSLFREAIAPLLVHHRGVLLRRKGLRSA